METKSFMCILTLFYLSQMCVPVTTDHETQTKNKATIFFGLKASLLQIKNNNNNTNTNDLTSVLLLSSSLQLLKSKSNGEVGLAAAAALPPCSGAAHEKNASTKVSITLL